jgi:hypothetical protein
MQTLNRLLSATAAMAALAMTTVSAQGNAQVDPNRRPAEWNRVDNTPAGQMKAYQLVQQAAGFVAKAGMEIKRALPVYGGHAHRAEYMCQFAQEDLRLTLEYRRPSPTGSRPVPPITADIRDRLEKIPEVRDKSKRDYPRNSVTVSDSQLNDGGVYLLEARECLVYLRQSYGGHLADAKELIELAITEIQRCIGRIRWAGRVTPDRNFDFGGWDRGG